MSQMASLETLTSDQSSKFERDGFFVMEDFFSLSEVEEVRREITTIVDRHPNVPEELVQIEPSVKRGDITPPSVELGVRKLFRMAKHNDHFRSIAFNPKMVGVAKDLVGPNITLFQTMLLMKPPHFGGSKVWHQDNAYFRLAPKEIIGFWIACDDTDPENGCMHVIPGSHVHGLAEHGGVQDDYGLLEPPSVKDAVACPMKAGTALVFHGEIYHYTPENTSDQRRRALQYHYANSICRSTKDSPFDPFTGEIVVAGDGAERQ